MVSLVSPLCIVCEVNIICKYLLLGDKDFANGLAGDDYIVKLPLGTVIRDNSTGEVVGELRSELDRVVVALGGLGGRGNAAMRTKGTKIVCTPPQAGEKRILKLELKLIADIGLVGVPNAGKSTLLDAITNAKPKIASYQFTTIVPNLGVCEVGGGSKFGGNSMIISDIPGLLEGAHLGVGLGRGFLRHVERCKIIIHIINGDSIDPVGDYVAINRELNLFSPELAIKPQIVVLNKIDLPHVQEKQQELLEKLKDVMPHKRLLPISAAGRIGLDELVEKSYNFLQKVKQDEEVNSSVEENAIATPTITVSWDSNTVATVYGPIITALIEEYNLIDQYYESSIRFQSLLEATGLYERLKDDYLSNFSNSFPSNGIRVNFGVQSGICLKLENGAFDVAKV